MAQLPPPVHGAALRNKSLLDSKLLNAEFNIISLPLKFIDDMKEMGKFSFNKIFLMCLHAARMFMILLTKKVDVVYFTMSPSGFAFYRDMLFISIIKLFRKKRILHFRMKGLQATSKGKFGRALIRFAFRGSEVICLSRHHTLDVQGLTDKPPFIVPNGIRVEKDFLYLTDEHRQTVNEIPKLLFLSNLSEKKGVPELIKALGTLRKKGYSFHCSIVGDEWYMSFAEARMLIKNEELNGSVTLEGPKTGLEKYTFISQADLFVFPTWFELFPGVILEAMQFGKPIVSTFEGSIPDIVDNNENGLLVEQRNVDQLTDAIAFMLDHPAERQRMALNAKSRFFRDFTLEAFERKMHDVFEEVMNK